LVQTGLAHLLQIAMMEKFIRVWGLGFGVWALLCSANVQAQRKEDLNALLSSPQRAPYKWFASTDPKGKNEDYVLLKPNETRRIPLSAGRLLRLWSTAGQPDKFELKIVNGPETVLLRDNKARLGEFYEKAFTLYPDAGTQSAVRNLTNGAVLVGVNKDSKPNKWYYQATVGESINVPKIPTAPIQSKTETAKTLTPNGGQVIFDPVDETKGVIEEIEIRLTESAPEGLRLQATWDGKQHDIDAPLLALASCFNDKSTSQSAAFSLRNRVLTLRWPMPFGPKTEIVLANTGQETVKFQSARVRYRDLTHAPQQAWMQTRFYARYGSSRSETGKYIPIFNVKGKGAFVGLNLNIRPTADSARRAFAFLEGNEIITADGKKYEGTGTEDYFNSAWYYPAKPFSRAFHGMPQKVLLPPQVSQYRLMIPDAVPFQYELKFDLGHGSRNNGNDLEYRWVAMWYGTGPQNVQISDALSSAADVSTHNAGPNANDTRFNVFAAALGALLFVVIASFARRFFRAAKS
jgi:hypothetical protein